MNHFSKRTASNGLAALILLCSPMRSLAQTNTPIPSGEEVTVATAGRTVQGKLGESGDKGWLLIIEARSNAKVYIPLTAIQSVRQGALTPQANQPPPVSVAAQRKKYVVYVHGICSHSAGFSNDWWTAMKPFTPDIPEANRREVLWSDLVNHAEGDQSPEQRELGLRLRETLSDRTLRERVDATGGSASGEESQAGVPLNIPFVNCIDDFVVYLTNSTKRNQIISRFNDVVEPLLQEEGAEIEVISHSWGTVVAYEALRLMDAHAENPGKVHNLYTVGSALSIGEVRRRLLPAASNGNRPANVQRWVNLNARNDVVGGPIKGLPFAVDFEFLNLPAVGCSSFFPNPSCAHSSYFVNDNVQVNRNIFGRFIELAN